MAPTDPETRPTQVAQWIAIVVTVAVSVGLAYFLPRAADATAPQDTKLAAGERVEAGGVSIEPPDGWALTGGTDLLVITKQDSKIVFFPPTRDKTTAKDSVVEAEKLFTDDKSLHATLGDVTELSNDAGLDAAYVTIAEQDGLTGLYAFSDGTKLISANLSSSPETYAKQQEEIIAMLATVEFGEGKTS